MNATGESCISEHGESKMKDIVDQVCESPEPESLFDVKREITRQLYLTFIVTIVYRLILALFMYYNFKK